MSTDTLEQESPPLTSFGRWAILFVAFFGWFCAGFQLSISSVVMPVAAADLLPPGTPEQEIGHWFGLLTAAFLFGAAAGGYVFGLIGDRIGRARAMAASIACYSIFSGLTWFIPDPQTLLVFRFVTCLGVGGMWPTGIALLSEAWSGVARPVLAGVMGTSANIGILCFSVMTVYWPAEQDHWRWTMLVGAAPLLLAVLSLAIVPESPRWLALRHRPRDDDAPPADAVGLAEVFRPPILRITLAGILIGTIPLFGGWGVSNWAQIWASKVGDRRVSAGASQSEAPSDPALKARANIARALPGAISSLLGGAVAFYLGRRRSYFVLCLCALFCTQMLFRVEDPKSNEFLFWMGALGFFSGFFFGWLPLCLPEMFPTRVRSTGAGVSFNWGRILAGVGVLATAYALRDKFEGRYADVGLVTGYIYAIGLGAILLAPPVTDAALED